MSQSNTVLIWNEDGTTREIDKNSEEFKNLAIDFELPLFSQRQVEFINKLIAQSITRVLTETSHQLDDV